VLGGVETSQGVCVGGGHSRDKPGFESKTIAGAFKKGEPGGT